MDKGSQRTTVRRAAPRPRRASQHEHAAPGDTSTPAKHPGQTTPPIKPPPPPSTAHPQEATDNPPCHPPAASNDTHMPGMARYLTDPAIEAEIQAFIATAPPLPEELRARLARMLGTKRCQHRCS